MVSPSSALEAFLRSIPLFSLVEPDEMLDILRLLRPVNLESGQVLFREREPGDAMWILGPGSEVAISASPGEGQRPVALAYAAEGETVGEMALVDDGQRSASAVVVQPGLAHQIEAIDFHVLRGSYNSAAYKVMRRICIDLCTKLRATNERIAPSSEPAVSAPALPDGPRPDSEELEIFPPFQGLPKVVKLALAQKLRRVDVSEVTPLFAEGEVADAAYFILEGEVTVGRNGRTLAHLGPGNMFGLVAVIDQGRRSASCITTGPARLLKLTDTNFDALFASRQRGAYQIVDLVARQLVSHLRQANALLPSPGASGRTSAAAQEQAPMIAAAEPPMPDSGWVDGLGGEDEVLREPEILPLELEMEVDPAATG
jgi:CRP/FNR family cyclic AMP-dependent transcriptional regulator